MSVGYACEHHLNRPGLPKRMTVELRGIFAKNLGRPISHSRKTAFAVSIETQEARAIAILAGLRDLRKGGYEVETLQNLKPKHIEYLVNKWVVEGLTRTTIENRITYFRALTGWIGKHNLVKSPEEYEAVKALPKRTGVTMEDKSWTGKGVDINQIITSILKEDVHVGVQMLLQAAFGLRAEESWLLKPNDCLMVRGKERKIWVAEGTKGGRPRFVPVMNDEQINVLELAGRVISKKHRTTIPERLTLKQWSNHYYRVLRKFGITKGEMGVTSHGLRHEYLQWLYTKTTGEECAVRGGAKPVIKELFEEAQRIVVETAGHSRPSKSNAYLGSHTGMQRRKIADITDEQILQAIVDNGGNKTKAAIALGCARSHLYRRLIEIDEKAKRAKKDDEDDIS